jgi:hypothetical protein
MTNQIKSGKEILDDFINEISGDVTLDQRIVQKITELYRAEKLTEKNLSNALLQLREENDN